MVIKEYVAKRKEEIKEYVSGLEVKPYLVVIQVNEDAGSNAYVKGKLKDCAELGIRADLIKLPVFGPCISPVSGSVKCSFQ